MPNHVTNRITGPKSLIDRLMGEHEGKPCVDFAKIVPVPDVIVQDSVASHVESAAEIALGLIDFANPPRNNALADFQSGNYGSASDALHYSNCVRQLREGPHPKDFNDADFASFLAYLRAWKETGYMNWYQWNTANWGTKWNAYDTNRISDEIVLFDTAWSAPHPVMCKLAESGGEFLHEWADEDTGSNVGRVRYSGDSEPLVEDLKGTREGYELAFEFDPDKKRYYRLQGDSYEYFDPDEVATSQTE